MRLGLLILLNPILHLGVSVQAANPDLLRLLGPQGVNLWKLNKAAAAAGLEETKDAVSEFEPQWFRHPLDHFTSDSSNATFLQRY
ncbi:hypothetical protein C8J57DRAFT_1365342 [Mycena rebaudengoi]|nr:hypothetical protein C8J57DRAFT_1365342 [Mycena rebaudengoi]